ncbi:MAG: HAMP domain-containing histidine kinase [Lachnospiraceae bacterium]|nr:HAMP domain-containing histidine kinase [Lachnospiraceae bacterium]
MKKKGIIKQSYYALEKGITEAYDMGYDLSDLFKKKRNNSEGSDESNLSRFLRELQEIYGVSTILMDSNNKTYSLFQNNSMFDRRMKDYIYKDMANNKNLKILEKNNLYTIAINDKNSGIPKIDSGTSDKGPSEYYESEGPGTSNDSKRRSTIPLIKRDADIECFGFLSDNETAFFLTIPVGSIKESIDLFNKVLIFVSLVIILIGSVAIYIISNNLTKPLLQLSEISKKMSRLEFENKYDGNSEDEIGILGNSMNELSLKLEKAIKELKNANIQLKADLEKKEQLDLMRQEFVANVSHELKTPIALIQGYTEGLETDGIVDSKEKRDYYLSVIKDETEKMNTMVHQLLDLSALERGLSELDISRINLNEIVSGVGQSFGLKIKDQNIKLDTDIPNDIYVWADGYKAEEVIKNYLSNAINHVDDNKIIKFYTTKINENYVRLNVFNSGIQLPDAEMIKVWEKFYKVDKARTRSYGGTGLGLSIVKAVAEQHKTTCGCENKEIDGHGGMVFYFDFPIR